MKIFALNFLTNNSINIARMFTYMGRCSVHNACDRDHVDCSFAQAGYTIGSQYRLLSVLYPDSVFILFKEDAIHVEDQLLYMYHNHCVNPYQAKDYSTFGVNFSNNLLPGIQEAVSSWYLGVETFFAGTGRLIVTDMSGYEGYNEYIGSNDFIQFCTDISPVLPAAPKLALGMQGRVLKDKPFPYIDYLFGTRAPGYPVISPMNSFLGGFAFTLSRPQNITNGYIPAFEKNLREPLQ